MNHLSEHEHASKKLVTWLLENLLYSGHLVGPTVAAYPLETVLSIKSVFYTEDGAVKSGSGTIQHAIAGLVEGGATVECIRDATIYMPEMSYGTVSALMQAFGSLRYYRKNGWLPTDDGGIADPRLVRVISISLYLIDIVLDIEATNHPDLLFGTHVSTTPVITFEEGLTGVTAFRDEHLVRFIFDRYEDGDRIIELARERGGFDVDLIASILDSGTQALSSGIL